MNMASSSSTHKLQHNPLFNPYLGTTAAPPPTPSTQTTTDTAASADTLTRLLHRLPPNLSLPTRLSPRAAAPTIISTPLPTLSLSPPSSSFQLGYFQLNPSDHFISPQLAESAESEALTLLDSPLDRKQTLFPTDWPLGYDDDDNHMASLCLEMSRLPPTTATELTSLTELSSELEKVGLHVVEKLACTMGFENPFRENIVNNNKSAGPSSLMWVSVSEDDDEDEGEKMGRVYPYVVGLQYQIRAQKWRLVTDGGGSVNVEPQVGSVLVTVGDIAQVWSNGKLKKVRGRAGAIAEDNGAKLGTGRRNILMTMLLTLPLESTVSPLLLHFKGDNDDRNGDTSNGVGDEDEYENEKVFNTFSFEDYAWRVYHERLHLKDPLDRYRILH